MSEENIEKEDTLENPAEEQSEAVNEKTENAEAEANESQAEPAANEAGEPGAQEAELKRKIETLEAEVQKRKNDYLMLYADFDNYKKRALKERSDLLKSSGDSIFLNMLPLVDDFERALKAAEDSDNVEALKEGVVNIHKKFISFLAQNSVTEIDTADKDFDTDFHDAIALVPAPGKGNKIIDCTQKGYMHGDKVLRHAKVVVGKDGE